MLKGEKGSLDTRFKGEAKLGGLIEKIQDKRDVWNARAQKYGKAADTATGIGEAAPRTMQLISNAMGGIMDKMAGMMKLLMPLAKFGTVIFGAIQLLIDADARVAELNKTLAEGIQVGTGYGADMDKALTGTTYKLGALTAAATTSGKAPIGFDEAAEAIQGMYAGGVQFQRLSFKDQVDALKDVVTQSRLTGKSLSEVGALQAEFSRNMMVSLRDVQDAFSVTYQSAVS